METRQDRLISKLVQRHLARATENLSQSIIMDAVRVLRPEIEMLVQQIVTDPLTGVLNRNALLNEQTISQIKTQMERGEGGIAIFDLDHFKKINDTHGHPVGDLALIHVVDAASAAFDRNHDAIYRYGGEEFVVITSDPDVNAFRERMKKFTNMLNESEVESVTDAIRVTASMGFVESSVLKKAIPELSVEEKGFIPRVLELPDKALYAAKEQGRNRVVEYDGMDIKVLQAHDKNLDTDFLPS